MIQACEENLGLTEFTGSDFISIAREQRLRVSMYYVLLANWILSHSVECCNSRNPYDRAYIPGM